MKRPPCPHCGDFGCLYNESIRPSSKRIAGIEFPTCGRYLPGGEFIAVSRGETPFAYCRKCMYGAIAAGVPESEFLDGDLAHCIPCGYHSAVLQ